jgi:hypothetical protein
MPATNRLYKQLGTRYRRRYNRAELPIVRSETEILAELAAQTPTIVVTRNGGDDT